MGATGDGAGADLAADGVAHALGGGGGGRGAGLDTPALFVRSGDVLQVADEAPAECREDVDGVRGRDGEGDQTEGVGVAAGLDVDEEFPVAGGGLDDRRGGDVVASGGL
ncbi:hypothetical protein [Streptomyces salinarius]|uniref:hypothetical protein n=1 Tax=Streptomyces salinarius TaxID=2762598 RepID=UPI002852D80B|nr:hypothetical protein [Streptomyces salinarius]